MANNLENFFHDNISTFNNIYSNNNKSLKFLQWNVRGINNLSKFDKILQDVDMIEPEIDLIVIGETWLKEENCKLYQIPNYKSVFSCREDSSGGLAVYINKKLKCKVKKKFHSNGFHHIYIEILMNGHYYDIHGLYRPPNYDFNVFSDYLEDVMSSSKPSNSCLILGDVNIPINHENLNTVLKYKMLLESYGFITTNIYATRPSSANILDHVVCKMNDANCIRNDTLDLTELSDHIPIITSLKTKLKKEPFILTKKIINQSLLNQDFSIFLNGIDLITDPENTLQSIISTYNNLLERYSRTVKKCVNLKGNSCPWMTFDLWTLRKIKENYLLRVKKHPTNQHLREMLSHISKKVESTKNRAKKIYYENLLTNTSHSKLWKNIKSTFGHTKSHETITLMNNGNETQNNTEVSEVFNNFFSSIGQNLASNIPPTGICPTSNVRRISDSIFLRPASENEIILLINNLNIKKSCGPDNIPALTLKNNVAAFAKILAQIFDLIIQTGVYPDCLKIAKVVPIFKSGETSDCNNYRPISTLSIFNKILEKMLVNRITDFLNLHKILFDLQYGFRPGSSTQTAIIELVDDILEEFDAGKFVGGLFLDLKKAFDTLNHDILLKKLECYGIRGIANNVLKSYLTNRKQFVQVGDGRSSLLPISVGVPQGSNIGPLLFILFINDIARLDLNGKPRLFADDTALFYPNKDIHTIIALMEKDLQTLNNFFNTNLLSLNPTKTKYMIFRSIRRIVPAHDHPRLATNIIEKVNCFKYLGIHLDPTLSWNNHIHRIEKRVASYIGILWRVRLFVPCKTLLQYYFAYIHTHFNYIISVWGRTASSHLQKLQCLQKRCLKIIFKKPLLYPTLSLYSDECHKILPISFLCDIQTLLFVHDILFNPKFHHNIQLTASNNSRRTRQANNLQRIRAITTRGQQRIRFIGPTLYNNLPENLQSIENRSIFNARIKQYYKNKLNELFT